MKTIKLNIVRRYLDELGEYTEDGGYRRYDSDREDSVALNLARLKYGSDATVSYSTKFALYFVKIS